MDKKEQQRRIRNLKQRLKYQSDPHLNYKFPQADAVVSVDHYVKLFCAWNKLKV